MMKLRTLIIAALAGVCCSTTAQTEVSAYRPGVTPEGAVYLLPRTALRFVVQIEKTTYTPGEFAPYAERYLGLHDVKSEPAVSYAITSIKMTPVGLPDTARCYSFVFNAKSAASNLQLSEDGILLAINAEARPIVHPAPFVPARKPATINPRQFLNETVLAAGSVAKRAELTAQEIFDIRESKNHLIRGEADFMPQDGEQLRLMLNSLERQDLALTTLFTGTTERDTTEQVIVECPMSELKDFVLFRFSRHLGLLDRDDMAGAPCYMTVEDLHALPEAVPVDAKKKKPREKGIYVNVAGRIKVDLTMNAQSMATYELSAGQFGHPDLLSEDLFNKRYTTHILLDPTTGAIEKIDVENIK